MMFGLHALQSDADLLTPSEAEDVASIGRRARLAEALFAGRLRVGMVGTFKAGKSSLINAMLGADVAAVDDLELTAASALFVASDADGVLVEREEGRVEGVPRATFDRHAATVRDDPGWWDDVVAVHVPVATEHPFDLVDTPGLGAITPGRSRRAREALSRCDGVVWVLGADDIGGAEEGRVLEELRRGGMPLLVALNKVDLLDDDEREEAAEWVADSFPWAETISLTSATTGEGVAALADRLTATLSVDATATRKQAADAAQRLVEQDLARLRETIILRIAPDVDRWAADLRILERKAELVERRLVNRMRDRVFVEFLAELEQALRANPDSVSEADLRERVNQELRSTDAQRFWGRFAERLPGELVEEWNVELELVDSDLDDAFAAFTERFLGQFVSQVSEARALVERADQDQTGRDVALVSAAAVAGAGYVAFLGPAASIVTFGAALSAVALPVAGAGAVALTLGKWIKGRQRDEEARRLIEGVVHEARQRAWSDFVEPELLPRLQEVHHRLVQAAAKELLGDERMTRLQDLLDALDPQRHRMRARALLSAP